MNDDKDSALWNALKRSKRIRNTLLGWCLIILSVLTGLVAAWGLWERLVDSIDSSLILGWVFAGGVAAGLPLALIGRRFLPLDARDALVDAQGEIRPFVLYLRPFRVDVGWHGWMNEPAISRSFEQIGVPVCVGRPGERLPPYGFYRMYLADADWRESVIAMASRAKCIVLVIGDTDSLRWEIQQIIDQRLLPRTILLIPARRHHECRDELQDQLGLTIPDLQAHYHPPVTPRRFDLCPVEFDGTTAKPVAIIPNASAPWLPPFEWLDILFRLVMWIVMFVVPWTKRYAWLVDRKRGPFVNYTETLKPVLARINAAQPYEINSYNPRPHRT